MPQGDDRLDELLSFPPLPSIEEEPIPTLSDILPLDYDSSMASIRTSKLEKKDPKITDTLETVRLA